MAKRAKADQPRRKIGERTEVIAVRLSPMQVEDHRATVIDLIQEGDELEERLKSSKADYKAKIAEVASKRAAAIGAIRSGKISREVTIEEWVTDRNEVIRLDASTGEEIGRRNATARELQEPLPLPDPEAAGAPEGDPVEDDGAEDADREVDEDAGDDFGDK